MHKIIKFSFLPAVFLLAILVWSSPILFKGYPAYTLTANGLLAKNHYLTGLYSTENSLNVFLPPSLLKNQGHLSAFGNKFTSLFYVFIFKIIGLPSVSGLVSLSIFLQGLTLLISTALVWRFFNFKTALAFSLIYIFIPFNWILPYHLGYYEFPLLFLSLFFWCFFLSRERDDKRALLFSFVGGIFLGLSCLTREAMLLFVPFLAVYLWLIGQKKKMILTISAFVLIFVPFWALDFKQNMYQQLFFTDTSSDVQAADFAFYTHVFPDAYTYHFAKEEFLDAFKEELKNSPLLERIDRTRELKNLGLEEISLADRIKAGLMFSTRHIFRFASWEGFGGPFALFVFVLGFYVLFRKDKSLARFVVYWILSAVFILSFVILAARDHLADFAFVSVLLLALGVIILADKIAAELNWQDKKKEALFLALLGLVLYNFVLAGHISLARMYDESGAALVADYGGKIGGMGIKPEEVIAVNLRSEAMYALNYETDKSYVLFTSSTVKKLLKEKKLKEAFEKFGVKYILAYPKEQSAEMIKQTGAMNIANEEDEIVLPEISRNKGWLMNLVK